MSAARSNSLRDLYVPRVVSFIVLLAIILLVGIVFFRVMAQFIVPLFLACVLLVVFQPLHRWFFSKMPRWPRLAALLTTVTIMLTVLAPTIYLGWNAYAESVSRIEAAGANVSSPREVESDVSTDAPSRDVASTPQDTYKTTGQSKTLYERLQGEAIKWTTKLNERTGFKINEDQVRAFFGQVLAWVGEILPEIAGAALRILIGLIIMIVALYYFFVDGPSMINGMMGLSPMDRRHELELLAKFAEISRSVVVATLLSAVAQGVLAGIGFYFALPSGAPIFLLVALSMVLAIVPFIGAAGVWVPVCIIIGLFGSEVFVVGGHAVEGGDLKTAIILGIYGAVVVSGIDNIIKPFVLHGQANLHPLLALLSILGGIQVLGPVGILVGPMLVSFLQALLAMFRKELERWEDPTQRSLSLSPGAQALAEQIEAAVEAAEESAAADKPSLTKSKTPVQHKSGDSKKKDR
jgi:predicted PurR-regulated permease PerM